MASGESHLKWVKEFHLDISAEVGKNLGTLLGKNIKLQDAGCSALTPEQLPQAITPPQFLCLIQVEGEYGGQGYLSFGKRDAILLAGLLSMVGEEALQERLEALRFEAADQDAFKEICNQLIGYANRVLLGKLPKKIHLRQGELIEWDKEEESPPGIEPLTYRIPIRLEIGEAYSAEFSYLFPQSLLQQFFPDAEPISGGEAQPESGRAAAKTSTAAGQTPVVLSPEVVFIPLGGTVSELSRFLEELRVRQERVNHLSELLNIFQFGRPRLLVLEADGNLDAALAVAAKLRLALRNVRLPIWIEGDGWTKDRLLRAVKAGVNYAVARPLNRELVSRRLKALI